MPPANNALSPAWRRDRCESPHERQRVRAAAADNGIPLPVREHGPQREEFNKRAKADLPREGRKVHRSSPCARGYEIFVERKPQQDSRVLGIWKALLLWKGMSKQSYFKYAPLLSTAYIPLSSA